jgi:copper chaperone
MKIIKFKTTINCNGCMLKAKRVLDVPEIDKWEVNVDDPDKILTVSTEVLSSEEIIDKLKLIGYKAETIS